MTPFEEIVEELRRDYHSAVLSEQVPVCSSFPIEDYRKDLWANARRETSRLHLRFFRAFQRDVTLNMTPFEEIVEELRRDYHSAVLSEQRDVTLNMTPFEEIVEELRRDYHSAVLSEQVPVCSSFLIEDYRKDLWANARRETSRLHLRRFFRAFQRDVTLNMTPFEEIVEELRRDYHSAVLSEQVPVCSSFPIEDYRKDLWANARRETSRLHLRSTIGVLWSRPLQPGAHPLHCSLLKGDYLKDLWANARLVTEKDRRKMVNKYDIMSALYKRAEYQGAVLSNQVPIHCSLLKEEYLKDLWANARRETSRLHLRRFFRAFQRDVTLNMTPFEEIVEELRRDYHSAVLSEQVPVCSSFPIEDYRKDLWANARRETSRLHPRFFRAFQRDVTLNMTPFEEIVEELRRDYHSAVLSEQVPVCSSFPIEDYRKDLWANARRETSRLHLRRFFFVHFRET
ncbi:hypothetical protein CDAR_407071 [Caerostris darwini]|uniref:Uncharacterized protein n=1 Tax=Caerostris darwini TaxID=1538125 RepID=A0AAV4Q0E7_9ARAC|nr:hypothetical protein CDAR_407071 [Caerostris darwini]